MDQIFSLRNIIEQCTNGTGSCKSTTWILRFSTASTKKVYGAYSEHMEFHNRSRPSPTSIFSPAATKTAWAPSPCEGDGDWSDMWWIDNQATSPAQPFTVHQRGSGNEGDPRTPGGDLWRGSSRPSVTHGGPFRSWLRANRSGMGEWVRYKNVKYFNLVHAHKSVLDLFIALFISLFSVLYSFRLPQKVGF